jgi:hypothetical protein
MLIGCEDRDIFLKGLNFPPEVWFIKNGEVIQGHILDSLKTSLKSPQTTYGFTIRGRDTENGLAGIEYNILEGSGNIEGNIQGRTFVLDELGIGQGTYIPELPDENLKLKITAKDNFGQTSSITLELFVFSNLSPVANSFEVRKTAINHPMEHELDASTSFDRDQGYGGVISVYEWTINDVSFQSPHAVSKHIFQNTGTYTISLRVKDNDGSWSNTLNSIVTIN